MAEDLYDISIADPQLSGQNCRRFRRRHMCGETGLGDGQGGRETGDFSDYACQKRTVHFCVRGGTAFIPGYVELPWRQLEGEEEL